MTAITEQSVACLPSHEAEGLPVLFANTLLMNLDKEAYLQRYCQMRRSASSRARLEQLLSLPRA